MDLAEDVRKICPNLEKAPSPLLEDIPLKTVEEVPMKEVPLPPEKKISESNPKIIRKQISNSNLSLKEKIITFTNSVLTPSRKHKRSQSSPTLWVDSKVFTFASKLEETEDDTHDYSSNPKFGMKPEEVFETVLETPKLLEKYRSYLQGIFADENLNFYLRVNDFEKIKENPILRKKTAEEIYEEFILRDAPQAINITGQEFAITELRFTKMEFSENMFSEAKGHIFQILKVAVMDFWLANHSK